MTEKELLEFAAKAAGYALTWKTGHCKGGEFCGAFIEGKDTAWNPRADDGDALRLAVKLRLVVCTPVPWFVNNDDHFYCCAKWIDKDGHEDWRHADFKVSEGGDPGAATRLAITLAAAEIGKAMQ